MLYVTFNGEEQFSGGRVHGLQRQAQHAGRLHLAQQPHLVAAQRHVVHRHVHGQTVYYLQHDTTYYFIHAVLNVTQLFFTYTQSHI